MPSIARRIEQVRERIAKAARAAGRDPEAIRLIAVSKTRPPEDLRAAHAAGLDAFGENYLQEALPKMDALADLPLEWHFIGRIQSNKTREIAERFDWVHGLDRLKHARRLSAQRPEALPPLECCIQLNLSGEDSKGGIDETALRELACEVAGLPRLRLRGLMTLPDPHAGPDALRATFERLAALLETLKTRDGLPLDTLSMGMSRDLETAIAAGATMVRVGTALFGPRPPAAR